MISYKLLLAAVLVTVLTVARVDARVPLTRDWAYQPFGTAPSGTPVPPRPHKGGY